MSTDSEEHRHRCEVRMLLAMRVNKGLTAARAYLANVEKRRGKDAAARLRTDATEQWLRGNRGEHGQWK